MNSTTEAFLEICCYCEREFASFRCVYCDTLYCSDECSFADLEPHKHFCRQLNEIAIFLSPLLRGLAWIQPDPELCVFDENVIKTYPGVIWHQDYSDFLRCLVEVAYLLSQMGSKPARAKALDIFLKLAKAPFKLNRRVLNRIIPALQIEFGNDELGAWSSVHDSALRNQEQIRVRKGKILAPRLVCKEDEWYYQNDPGLIGIRILLQIKTIWTLENMRNVCLIGSKLPKELEIEVQKHMASPEAWPRLESFGLLHDLGSGPRLGRRIRRLRQRIRKNIRKVHIDFPYFFPAFFTALPNAMLDSFVDDFFPRDVLYLLEHECGWSSCYEHYDAHAHVAQVAFRDIYGAYASAPGAIQALRFYVETTISRLLEIEPYLQDLDAYELTSGEELNTIRLDNARKLIPEYQ